MNISKMMLLAGIGLLAFSACQKNELAPAGGG